MSGFVSTERLKPEMSVHTYLVIGIVYALSTVKLDVLLLFGALIYKRPFFMQDG